MIIPVGLSHTTMYWNYIDTRLIQLAGSLLAVWSITPLTIYLCFLLSLGLTIPADMNPSMVDTMYCSAYGEVSLSHLCLDVFTCVALADAGREEFNPGKK